MISPARRLSRRKKPRLRREAMTSSGASIRYCGAQDTFYAGNPRVERVYQQTFIDAYTKVAFAKLYDPIC
jgi:hypothetical protein